MGQIHLDCKETTPCGGTVRFDVDESDMITSSSFSSTATCSKCRKCSWHLMCPDADGRRDKPLKDIKRNLSSTITLRDLIWSKNGGPGIIDEQEAITIARSINGMYTVEYTGTLGEALWGTIKPLLDVTVCAIHRQIESTLILLL